MGIDTLPPELIDIICTFCDSLTIKELRLACRTLRDIADKHVLEEIVVYYNRKSLKDTGYLVENASLVKPTRTLYFAADRLEDFGYQEWDLTREVELLKDSPEPQSTRTESVTRHHLDVLMFRESLEAIRKAYAKDPTAGEHSVADHLVERYEFYRYLFEDQSRLVRHGVIRRCLAAIFRGCAGLDSIHISVHGEGEPIGWYSKAFQWAMTAPHGDPDYTRHGTDAARELALAAHDAGFTPRNIRLDGISHHFLINSKKNTPKVKALFRNVEKLRWTVATPMEPDSWMVNEDELEDFAHWLREGHIVDLLKNSIGLRELHLEMPMNDYVYIRPDIAKLVGDTIWPNLVYFHLEVARVEPASFADFFLRHADMLRIISLGDIWLLGLKEEWPDCFRALAGKLPYLHTVELRGTFGSRNGDFFNFGDFESPYNNAYGEQVAAYCISPEGEFPPPPEIQEGDLKADSEVDPDI